MPRKALITIRRGTEKQLVKTTLAVGELGFTVDTKKLFIGTANGNLLISTGNSKGDMSKGVYDTDNDGIVDAAQNAYTLQGHSADDFILRASRTWNELKGALSWNQLRGGRR